MGDKSSVSGSPRPLAELSCTSSSQRVGTGSSGSGGIWSRGNTESTVGRRFRYLCSLLNNAQLSKGSRDLKPDRTQEKTPFSGIFLHTFAPEAVSFVPNVGSRQINSLFFLLKMKTANLPICLVTEAP